MTRRLWRTAALAVLALAAGAAEARASYTIDLIWAESGNSHLDVLTPGGRGVSSGTPCHAGARSEAGAGYCLFVQFTAAEPFQTALVTLGWDAAATGIAVEWAPERSFGRYGANGTVMAPVASPIYAAPGECVSQGCDSAFGSFGGAGLSPTPAGTSIIGSVNIDLSGAIWTAWEGPFAFLRTGVDGVLDKKAAFAPVHLGSTTLWFAPEPGTAGLVGLGIVALATFAPKRRD